MWACESTTASMLRVEREVAVALERLLAPALEEPAVEQHGGALVCTSAWTR